jgi:hypothetical protein
LRAFIGVTGRPGTCPAAAATIPSHIEGATAGRASRFAISVVECRRDRQRRALGEGAGDRARSDARLDRSPQRAREEQDPDDRGEAQLPADVGRDSRLDGEGDHRRHRQPVEA